MRVRETTAGWMNEGMDGWILGDDEMILSSHL
jgi:hypothetical protein